MLGSGMNLITTVIGFGMSATFIVFVFTRLICGRMRASQPRPVSEMEDSRTDMDEAEHRITGLEPVHVASLPSVKYNRETFQYAEDAQCSICLGEYEEKEILRVMPKCQHNFHLACIDVWLEKQSTCPVCRLPLQEPKHSPRFGLIVESIDGPRLVNNEHSQQWILPIASESLTQGNYTSELLRRDDETIPSISETNVDIEMDIRR